MPTPPPKGICPARARSTAWAACFSAPSHGAQAFPRLASVSAHPSRALRLHPAQIATRAKAFCLPPAEHHEPVRRFQSAANAAAACVSRRSFCADIRIVLVRARQEFKVATRPIHRVASFNVSYHHHALMAARHRGGSSSINAGSSPAVIAQPLPDCALTLSGWPTFCRPAPGA